MGGVVGGTRGARPYSARVHVFRGMSQFIPLPRLRVIMTDEAEKTLRILRSNLTELTSEVEETEKGQFAKADVKQRATLFGERITQDLLAVDGVEISKSKAEEALLKKDRKLAQKISVLLARRKRRCWTKKRKKIEVLAVVFVAVATVLSV